MSGTRHDPDHTDTRATATLLKTTTGFEAEAIAAALRERGVEARAVDTTTGAMLSNQVSPPRVIVLAHELEHARVVLDQVQTEASQIDWSQVELGEAEAPPLPPRTRWTWTLAVLLVPVGLVVLSIGTQRNDRLLQTIGGAVLAASMVIAIALMFAASRSPEPSERP